MTSMLWCRKTTLVNVRHVAESTNVTSSRQPRTCNVVGTNLNLISLVQQPVLVLLWCSSLYLYFFGAVACTWQFLCQRVRSGNDYILIYNSEHSHRGLLGCSCVILQMDTNSFEEYPAFISRVEVSVVGMQQIIQTGRTGGVQSDQY